MPLSVHTTARTGTKAWTFSCNTDLGVPQMNSDEMNWLLQTIETPEIAKRFIRTQYERGRISYDVMVKLAQEHGSPIGLARQHGRSHLFPSSLPQHTKQFSRGAVL